MRQVSSESGSEVKAFGAQRAQRKQMGQTGLFQDGKKMVLGINRFYFNAIGTVLRTDFILDLNV